MITIDVLPDNVLLEIFSFYVVPQGPFRLWTMEAWQSLVHVCHRWRCVVFGSPRRLNLRLVCSPPTPVRDTLDVWPELPLLILADVTVTQEGADKLDNVVAALERSDRVDEIRLDYYQDSAMENVFAAMQVPLPKLVTMQIIRWKCNETATAFPDSFLGGSAPRLRDLYFWCIPFPGLPKLILSATHLVNLTLQCIPHSGYFSPESIATALSTLISLENLFLNFLSPQCRPEWKSRRPPPLTRSVLPVLTSLAFKGDSEYIDDLVACIDTPRLFELNITFFNQVVFDTPQFIQFISRTPTLKDPEMAHVSFEYDSASVRLTSCSGDVRVQVRCREFDWRVSSMEQVCTWCLPPLSTLEDLYMEVQSWESDRQDNIENVLWLELLQPFATVKNLYLSKNFAPYIVPALQELVGGRQTEVLPTLRNIFLEGLKPSGPVHEGIEKFVGMRQGPIAVSPFRRNQEIEESDEESDEDGLDDDEESDEDRSDGD